MVEVEPHHAVGRRDPGRRPEEQHVEDARQRGHRADAERQGKGDGEGEAGAPAEGAEGVEEVVEHE